MRGGSPMLILQPYRRPQVHLAPVVLGDAGGAYLTDNILGFRSLWYWRCLRPPHRA
jgi:hypothetical protein